MASQEASNWRATIVFFSIDALGHINPVLSLMKELRNRRIRAIILTIRPLSIADRLQSMGLELEYCEEQDLSQIEGNNEEKIASIVRPLMDIFRQGVRSAFIGTYRDNGVVNKYLDDIIIYHDVIEAKLKSLKPDIIVVDHVIGVPCTTSVAPKWARFYSSFPSALLSNCNQNYVAGLGIKPDQVTSEDKDFEARTKAKVRGRLSDFWIKKGYQDWPSKIDLAPSSPYLNFYMGPKELGLELEPSLKPLDESRWFRLEHTLVIETSGGRFEMPPELAAVPGKLIYFSLGTLVSSDVELIDRLLKMLSKSPNKFIISMGQMHEYIKLYPNMWGQKFIDQKKVLPEIDLFVTHGGHNSVVEAFYFGVPGLVVLPIFADQFDAAQRVQDCGFGIRLNPFECSEDELLNSINTLLDNEELKRRMQSIGSRLRSIRYDHIAADLLEQQLLMT